MKIRALVTNFLRRCAPIVALLTLTYACASQAAAFSPGSFIIPMDTGTSGQNNGMLRAYGLVYELLRNNVPVYWVINSGKVANGDDFVISAGGNSVQNVKDAAVITLPRSYRGGPFVVDSADAAAATPIIQAWQAALGDNTVVHRLTAGSFVGPEARTLIGAPRIAVLKDGNEQIALNNLNAAGIADSAGGLWNSSSPDLLTEAAVAGATTVNHTDGILFHPANGAARYGYVVSMHYITTATTPEVVQEVRSWLSNNPFTHAFMQCEAIRAFENATAGRFLTTLGLDDDGSAPTLTALRAPSNPLIQLDGTFEADSGSVDSIGLAGGSTFRSGVTTLINNSASPLNARIVELAGHMDGSSANGNVTYLAGHDYSLDLPITSNPQTSGVRLFLNSLFESGVATNIGQSDVVLTLSAPALINSNTITYTINYSNPGPQPVENLMLTDRLPIGTTFVSATGGGTHSGGVVTWNLPALASGANASVNVTIGVTSDGAYANAAQLRFSHLIVKTITSNPVLTVRDTIPPTVTIFGEPIGYTSDATPSFTFTVGGSPVLTQCRIDGGAFVPAASPFTVVSPLTDGPHTFEVRVTDAAGNSASATRSFFVDTTPSSVGSLIIPMDTGTSGQNNGMLRAYGLVYELLRQNIPVYWMINSGKAANGDDFVISAGGNSVQNVKDAAVITLPRSYRGGPFVVESAAAAAALPIIQAWQATVGDNTVVHRVTAGSFVGPIARTLVGAPRIAVLKDGNEQIAFNNLNAAGITNSAGGLWSATSPDLLTEADVAGATTINHADGILFHPANGAARYGYIVSMHYITTATTPEVVQEVRSWLSNNPFTHAFMQCEAIRAFENATAGRFLTTLGLDDDGSAPTLTALRAPSNPLIQLDGTFEADSGSVDSIGLAGGSTFRSGVTTLINNSASPLTSRIVELTGRMDGSAANGNVTYLAGHDYSLDLPITSNPQTSGVRLFLNSLFESGVATNISQSDVVLTLSAPALINSSNITYTIRYSNPGPQPVENLVLTDALPLGTTFVSATDGGTHVGGIVTWNLPALAAGTDSFVSVTVSATGYGSYTNAAQLRFTHLTVRTITSNTATTIRNTPPVLTNAAWINGAFRFTIQGAAGTNYAVEATTNFSLWTSLATNVGPAFDFTNLPPTLPWRFFRARLLP